MRIALVSMHFAEYAMHLAGALAQQHDVLLLLESGNAAGELGVPEHSKCEGRLKVEMIAHRKMISTMAHNARRIVSVVREFRPDIVHFQEASSEYVVWAAWGLKAYPCVLTIHDPFPHIGESVRSLSTLRHAINRWLMRRWCTVAVTHGTHLVAEVLRAIPRLQGRVVSVPHGPLGNGHAVTESEMGCLLFFGRLQKYKGLVFFVEAVKRLHAEGLPVRAVIAGRGEDLADLRKDILNHPAFELHERYIDNKEVPKFFSRASIVVLPYTDGTQSGVAAMAIGYGRAVVASRVGSIPEMVRDGLNGCLVPAGDVDALTDTLRGLLLNPALVASMGRDARQLAETEMSWARNAEISVSIYRRAIGYRYGHG